MGTMNHNAVIATTCNEAAFEKMIEWISGIEDEWRVLFEVSGAETVNGYKSICLMPDGSKEGWPESNTGDELRAAFIEVMRKEDYSDRSNPWSYVEVGFGEYGQTVLRGNNKNNYNDQVYAASS